MCLRKRRRITTILLFPVIAVFFMVGYVLSAFGEPRTKNKKAPKRKTDAPKKAELAEENDLEMGLMKELEQEQIAAG
jgi:hypothetical protein